MSVIPTDTASRAIGTVVGSAVGDALGAPFEFQLGGAFRERFGDGTGEMYGGGGWDPGEATDDTQMAVLVAESLLDHTTLNLPDIFARFQRWAAAEPKDIGLQTEDVLTNGEPWDRAAALHFQINIYAAGNGSLMRAATSAVHFAHTDRETTMSAARRIAALTHGDRTAWEGTAVFHELIRAALHPRKSHPTHAPTTTPTTPVLAAVPGALAEVHPDHRARWAKVLAPDWHPDDATEFNGAVWPCLGSALWALRTTDTFEDALAAAIDLGGDTDTVAAVTGALAGASYGAEAIPTRWTDPLHVPLPGFDNRTLRFQDLRQLALNLDLSGPSGTPGPSGV